MSLFQNMLKDSNLNSFKQWLGHAFAIDSEFEFAEEDQKLLQKMADWLLLKNLAEPAIMVLETCKPLNFIGSQALVFMRPFFQLVFKKKDEFDRFTALLENRQSLEKFIRILEDGLKKQDDKDNEGETASEK